MTKQSKCAYLAGLLDGEGSFSIIKTGGRYQLHIKIATTTPQMLRWVVKHFGGTIYTKKPFVVNWRTRYDWQCPSGKATEPLLLSVLPYLTVKKQQANTALKYVRLNGAPCPSVREELHQEMMKLNSSRFANRPTTNTPDAPKGVKIESELHGDMQSAPAVTLEA